MLHFSKLNSKIVKVLLQEETVTVKRLSEEVGLSEKTVRERLKEIDGILKESDIGEVVRKPSAGVRLRCSEEKRSIVEKSLSKDEQVFEGLEADAFYLSLLMEILRPRKEGNVTAKYLSEKLYSSRTMIDKELSKCRLWLKRHQITAETVRNRGIVLRCDGMQYRIAVKHFIYEASGHASMEDVITELFPGMNIREVKRCVMAEEKNWNISFTKKMYTDIIIYLCTCIACDTLKVYPVETTVDRHNEISKYEEYSFSASLFKRIEERFRIKAERPEVDFIALQLLCFSIVDHDQDDRMAEENLDDFVKEVMRVSSIALNVDLNDDKVLFASLKEHMRQALFRLRYNREVSNEMIDYIKREFSYSYKLVPMISILFEYYFNIQISENELGYIILYLRVAAKRKKHSIDILIVSEQHKSVIEYISSRLQELTVNVRHIKVVGIREFRTYIPSSNELVLTTEEIPDREGMIRVDPTRFTEEYEDLRHQIEAFVNQRSFEKIRFDVSSHAMFDVDLLFVGQSFSGKEELIRMVTDVAEHKGYVTKNYYSSVIERERKTSTAIGDGIATPQGKTDPGS